MGGLGSGGARPNSGPKPRSLRDRALTNPRIRLDDANVAPFPSPQAAKLRDWRPTPAQRRALGPSGRRFLDSRLKDYALTPAEGDFLLMACRSLDEANLWRRRAHAWRDPAAAVRAGRLQLLHERQFMSAIGAMKEQR